MGESGKGEPLTFHSSSSSLTAKPLALPGTLSTRMISRNPFSLVGRISHDLPLEKVITIEWLAR